MNSSSQSKAGRDMFSFFDELKEAAGCPWRHDRLSEDFHQSSNRLQTAHKSHPSALAAGVASKTMPHPFICEKAIIIRFEDSPTHLLAAAEKPVIRKSVAACSYRPNPRRSICPLWAFAAAAASEYQQLDQ
jgi:hypothetical protein